MNKADLIDHVAVEADLTKLQSRSVVNTILDTIQLALGRNDDVVLVGFGTFSVRNRAERQGRDPSSGKAITIKASKVPTFKAGALLKRAVE